MESASTEQLVLARLATADNSGTPHTELIHSPGSTKLSEQIALAATIEELREAGLIETVSDGEETLFVLTEQGKERADAVYEALLETEITIVDDGRKRLTVAEATAQFDRSPVEVYAALSDDGVYVPPADESTDQFIDRETELDRARTVLDAGTRDRAGSALLFSGPGGVGKTALLETVLDEARDRGYEVLGARCRSADDPFQPIRACLAPLDETPFEDRIPAIDDPDDYRAQQSALFHDLTGLLTPGTDEPPRLLWFEDIHLVDPSTARYLSVLFEQLSTRPVVVVATCRAAELPASLGGELEDPAEHLHQLDLAPFSPSETRQLVEQTVGRRGAPDALVDAIQERTGGNPRFIEDTVEQLLDAGSLDPGYEWYPETPAAIDLPDSVTDVVIQQVEALPEPADRLLRWAALVGQTVPVDLLAAVCDLDPDRLERLLETLVEAGVFEWTDGAVAFRNTAFRDALETSLPADEQRRRHAVIAEAMCDHIESTTSAAAAQIATQYEQAGNSEPAIEWYCRAGERAKTLYAHEVAVEQFHSALALARELDDEVTILDIAQSLAEVYLTTDQYDDAERFAGFVSERTDDLARKQWAAIQRAEIANMRGKPTEAVEHTEQALGRSSEPTPERVELLLLKARAYGNMGEYDRVRETAQQQLETAELIDEAELIAAANLSLGKLAWRQDDYDAASEYLDTALEIAEQVGDRKTAGEVYLNRGVVAWQTGAYEEAREAYGNALTEFEAISDRNRAAMAHNNIADVATEQGNYEDAESAYRRALDGFEATGNRRGAAIARMNLGKIDLRLGKYSAAETLLTDALEELDAAGVAHVTSVARLHLGAAALRQGSAERARELLDSAREGFEAVEDRHRIAAVDLQTGYLALADGDTAGAREYFDRALDGFETVEAEQDIARGKLGLGRVAFETGALDQALEHTQAALDTFDRTDASHERARARDLLGQIARQRGETDRAREQFDLAADEFEQIGAVADALSTLESLVALCRAVDADPDGYLDRASTLAGDASEQIVDEHGSWLDS